MDQDGGERGVPQCKPHSRHQTCGSSLPTLFCGVLLVSGMGQNWTWSPSWTERSPGIWNKRGWRSGSLKESPESYTPTGGWPWMGSGPGSATVCVTLSWRPHNCSFWKFIHCIRNILGKYGKSHKTLIHILPISCICILCIPLWDFLF